MRRFAQFGSIYTIYSRLCVFFMFFKIAQKVPNHPKHHIKFYISRIVPPVTILARQIAYETSIFWSELLLKTKELFFSPASTELNDPFYQHL